MHLSNRTSTCISRNAEHRPDGDQDGVCQHHTDVHQDVENCNTKVDEQDKGNGYVGCFPS